MHSTRSLIVSAMACVALFHSLPADAEEERHQENERHRSASNNPARTPPAGVSGPAAPTSPRATESQDPSDSGHRSVGESILMDLLFDSHAKSDAAQYSAPRSDYTPTRFSDLSSEPAKHWYLVYAGGGAGKSLAYYPSNSSSHLGWKMFFGARTKNFGIDFGLSHLSTIRATINSQQVDVSTDAAALSVMGYLPLAKDADLLLKYGGVSWHANANSDPTGNLPVANGTSRVLGFGLEGRDSDGEYFLRLEKEFFRDVYQSKFYTWVGLSVGGYF